MKPHPMLSPSSQRSFGPASTLQPFLGVLISLILLTRLLCAETAPASASGHALVNGAKIWWESEGDGNPIVLIAGGPGSSHSYLKPFFHPLAQGHRLIFFDALGRGKSDRPASPAEYSFNRDVEDLEGLRQALKLEQWTVLGHSYGGMVAQAYALRHPSRVTRLILSNTLHSDDMWQAGSRHFHSEVQLQYPEIWDKISELRRQGKRSMDPEMSRLLFEAIPEGLLYFFNAGKAQPALYDFNPDVYYAIAGPDADFTVGGSVLGLDFRPQLPQLTMPILILSGRFDRIATPRDTLEYRRCLPKAQHVIFEQSGHMPFLEENSLYLETLGKFIATKPAQ